MFISFPERPDRFGGWSNLVLTADRSLCELKRPERESEYLSSRAGLKKE